MAISELDTFISLALEGFGYVTVAPEVTDTMRRLFSDDDYEAKMEHYEKLATFSEDQISKGFPYLFSIACVRLWTILEACVDEVLFHLINDPRCISESRIIKNLKGPLLEFANASDNEKAEFLKDRLNQELASSLKIGVGRFEDPLKAVGFGGSVADPIRRVLLELSEIRNVIVHKNGLVDKRLVERCPWMSVKVGEKIVVTLSDYPIYANSCFWYIVELADRWKRLYPSSLPDIEDWENRSISIHKKIESMIEEYFSSRG